MRVVGRTRGVREVSVQQMASLDELTSTSHHLSEAAGKLAAAVKRFTVNGSGGS